MHKAIKFCPLHVLYWGATDFHISSYVDLDFKSQIMEISADSVNSCQLSSKVVAQLVYIFKYISNYKINTLK